jgi:hypothetical protein
MQLCMSNDLRPKINKGQFTFHIFIPWLPVAWKSVRHSCELSLRGKFYALIRRFDG